LKALDCVSEREKKATGKKEPALSGFILHIPSEKKRGKCA